MEFIYITLYQVTFVSSLGLAFFIWQIRLVRGAPAFFLTMLSTALWSLAVTLQLVSSSIQMAEFWLAFRFISISLMPVFWLLFVLQYNQVGRRYEKKWHIGLLYIIPAVNILLILSNFKYHLFIKDIHFLKISNITLLESWQPAACYPLFLGYSLLISTIMLSFLFWKCVHTRGYQRNNNLILLAGSLGMIVIALMYQVNLLKDTWFGLLPIIYISCMCLYVWATFRYQLFGLLPTIRGSLVPWLDSGMMLLDENKHILFANPQIENIFSLKPSFSIGGDIHNVLPQVCDLLSEKPLVNEQRIEMSLSIDEKIRKFEVHSIRMDRQNFGRLGWLLTFHDITQLNRNREMIINAKKEWEATFDAVSAMIILADHNGYIFRCNRITCDWFDATYTQLLGRNISCLFYGDDHPSAGLPFPHQGEIQFPRLPGWFELAAYPLEPQDESSSSWVYIVQDITSRKQTEQELNLYARRLEGIHTIDHAILSMHTRRDIARAVLAQIDELSIGQYSSVWLLDRRSDRLQTVASSFDRHDMKDAIDLPVSALPERVLQGDLEFSSDIHENDEKSAFDLFILQRGWLSYVLVPLVASQEFLGVLCLASEHIMEFSKSQWEILHEMGMSLAVGLQNALLFEKIQHLAITDPLTGLYNRRHFFEITGRELERARRFDFDISLVMMDVDNFKMINDENGHLVGDHVLQALASVVRENMRRYDVLARFGGEEFVVLLPRTDASQAMEFAGRLMEVIRGLCIESGKETLKITVSMGLTSTRGKRVESIEALIECADQAMYSAKSAGRNRIVSNEMC